MPKRNFIGVRKVGKLWMIDFRYLDSEGRSCRYKRLARVQTGEGAKLEALKLQTAALRDGGLAGAASPKRARPVTMAELWARYEAEVLTGLKPATRRNMRSVWRTDLLPSFGERAVSGIATGDYRALASRARERGILAHPLCAALGSLLKFAAECGLVGAAPRAPKLPRIESKPTVLPDIERVRAAIARESRERLWLATAVALGAFGGLRSGECRALRVGDVDFVTGAIRVHRGVSAGEVTTTKSGRSRRVPFEQGSVLGTLLKRACQGRAVDAPVVSADGARPASPQGVLTGFQAAMRAVGGELCRFHDLRHLFGSRVAEHASPAVARDLMGHASLQTSSRYIHAKEGAARAAVSALN
jgi:integrase